MKNVLKILAISLFIFLSSCSKPEDFLQNNNPASIASNTTMATRPSTPVAVDRVQIGSQIWMTKNLNVSRYRNGDIIPQVTDQSQWSTLTTGAWCYYANNSSNGAVFGKIYNWYAVNDPRGLAPQGWHIPSNAEYNMLAATLGGSLVAGGKMKTTTLWSPPNTGADNSSGFTAYPSGYRGDGQTSFYGSGLCSCYWTSTPGDDYALVFFASYNSANTNIVGNPKGMGNSVRCLKD